MQPKWSCSSPIERCDVCFSRCCVFIYLYWQVCGYGFALLKTLLTRYSPYILGCRNPPDWWSYVLPEPHGTLQVFQCKVFQEFDAAHLHLQSLAQWCGLVRRKIHWGVYKREKVFGVVTARESFGTGLSLGCGRTLHHNPSFQPTCPGRGKPPPCNRKVINQWTHWTLRDSFFSPPSGGSNPPPLSVSSLYCTFFSPFFPSVGLSWGASHCDLLLLRVYYINGLRGQTQNGTMVRQNVKRT